MGERFGQSILRAHGFEALKKAMYSVLMVRGKQNGLIVSSCNKVSLLQLRFARDNEERNTLLARYVNVTVPAYMLK